MAETIEDVKPFERVKDVDVIMTVIKPQPVVGLGNLLILKEATSSTPAPNGQTTQAGSKADKTLNQLSNPTPAVTGLSDTLSGQDIAQGVLMRKTDPVTGAQYTEYKDADAVGAYEDQKGNVYKKAEAYFNQASASDRIAVLTYPQGKLNDALKAFWWQNFTFMVFADPQLTNGTASDDAIIASNACEANKDHFLVLQAEDPTLFTKFEAQNFTIGLVHDLNEPMDVALIGTLATKPAGSVDWKFKSLTGITPEAITATEKDAYDNLHAIAYIEVAGKPQTSGGWVLSGDYIDSEHGDIFVKTTLGADLQHYLQSQDKVSYDQSGINALGSIVTRDLEKAYAQGIILTNEATGKGDFSVSTSPRSAQKQADISARHYGGITFWYHRSGAIDTVTVKGTVQSDTITNSK